MSGCFIVCRSVTYAQRAKKVLERAGITAIVVRPNIEMLDSGCGFAVKISETYLAEALSILKKYNFNITKVLYVEPDGRYREMRV